ncbi:MAG: D-alanyl-D-alanine carboxypeptidase [Desulfobacterales bacterium]
MKFPSYSHTITTLLLIFFMIPIFSPCLCAETKNKIEPVLGKRDAVLVRDLTRNTPLLSINEDKLLTPASILKILTSLVVIDALGLDHRFKTEFFLDRDFNLKIKGYGDPLLLSETIPGIVTQLGDRFQTVNDIILDDTYFTSPITIPGAAKSSVQPYDAPNGALCVNFNTVFFKKNPHGRYISAEPQTPLLPFVLNRITRSSLNEGRIILTSENHEFLLYAGHLFNHFLQEKGIKTKGTIRIGSVDPESDQLILRYRSPFELRDIIIRMLYYSNNFSANQLLIAAGAARYGYPGTLQKGVRAVQEYSEKHLGIDRIQIVEGSGLSKKNRLSATMMGKILDQFKPYRTMLRQNGRELYKTGTLTGIRTRAGYLESEDGRLISFVILLNSGKSSSEKIMKMIHAIYGKRVKGHCLK